MKEENQFMEIESLEGSDFSSSDEDEVNSDWDSPEKRPAFISRIMALKDGKVSSCKRNNTLVSVIDTNKPYKLTLDLFCKSQNPQKLAIRIDGEPDSSKQGFRASIDPWKLINLSREKALLAREKLLLMKQKPMVESDPLKPLPLETRSGPVMKPAPDKDTVAGLIAKGGVGRGGQFSSSPRRRLSSSPITQQYGVSSPNQSRYRSDFDLKLTQVSRELETYISRQVLCSVLKNDGSEASPR